MCGISVVCDLYGLTPRAVRFYETRGLLKSGRDQFNCRKYDARARDRLAQIAAYRRAGLSVEGILEIFAAGAQGGAVQRACAAQKLRARLRELEATRRHVEQLLEGETGRTPTAANSDTGRRAVVAR